VVDYDREKGLNGKGRTGQTPERVPKGYVTAIWIKYPILHGVGGRWEITDGKHTERIRLLLPPAGFVVPTRDGLYRFDTGTPFATIRKRKKAIREWVKFEYKPEVAEREISYFEPGEPRSGKAAVLRLYNNQGPFSISAKCGLEFSGRAFGTRPAQKEKKEERIDPGLLENKGSIRSKLTPDFMKALKEGTLSPEMIEKLKKKNPESRDN